MCYRKASRSRCWMGHCISHRCWRRRPTSATLTTQVIRIFLKCACVCVCVTDSAVVSDWFAALWQFSFFFFPVCFVFQSQVQANLNQSNASGDALESVLTDFDWFLKKIIPFCAWEFWLYYSSVPPSRLHPTPVTEAGRGWREGTIFESLCFIWALFRCFLPDHWTSL